MSLVDMYVETGDPSEKCGELNFSLDYDFATQTLKLKMIQVSLDIQSGCSGCRTGNGKKLSNSQACCLDQLCLGAA